MPLRPSFRSAPTIEVAPPTALRENRNFLLLWFGQSVSNVGDWINFVAITVLIYQITGSGLALGVLRATHAGPELVLGALAGVYIDRWDRKTSMIAADLIRAGLVALMAISTNIAEIYFLSLGLNAATIFFNPAKSATIPNLVHPSTLTRANGLSSTTQTMAMAFGSSIGGIAIALAGLRQAFYLDSASYLVSALCILLITVPRSSPEVRSESSFWDQLRGGWDELRTQPILRGVTIMASALVVGPGVSTVLAVILAERVLNTGTAGYSVIVTAMGVGSLIAAVVVSAAGNRFRRDITYRVGFGLAACGAVLVGTSRSVPLTAVGYAILGGGQIAATIAGMTLIQENTDDKLRGRIFGMYGTLVHVFSLLAAALAGGLADPLGAATVITGVGIVEVGLSPLTLVLVRAPKAGTTTDLAIADGSESIG